MHLGSLFIIAIQMFDITWMDVLDIKVFNSCNFVVQGLIFKIFVSKLVCTCLRLSLIKFLRCLDEEERKYSKLRQHAST